MIRRVEPAAMWTLRASRAPTDRARARITALQESGRALAEREDELRRALREAEAAGGGRLARRRVGRAQRRLIRAAEVRERRVRDDFDGILHDLRDEAAQAGAELDSALEPLERLRGRWTEIGEVFAELEETIRARELAPFLAGWDGALSVPAFPVTAQEDVPAPFPPTAFVF
jgi:chromosome segregation ATPase